MNLRDLSYVVALDKERHFGRAAARCFVSQPTLSGQIRKLEQELGVTLFERSTRGVVMTPVGREISDRARRVLNEVQAIREAAEVHRDPLAGDLQVGLIPTVGPYLLPLFMPAARKRYPALRLYLHEHQTASLLELLRSGSLDAVILALPVETDEFVEIDLFEEPFWLAVPRDDPLRAKARARMDDLAGREVLLLEEGHCLRGQALDVCVSAGASEYSGFRATSLETLRHMVGEGLGSTLMPELAVPATSAEESAVHYMPFSGTRPVRRVGMLYRRGSPREAAFAALAETIQEAVNERLAQRRTS